MVRFIDAPPARDPNNMKLLIAEDDLGSRRLLQTLVTHWGYDAVVTKDGLEAWHAFERDDAPPLALLDWNMPGMNGIEVCLRVKESPRLRSTYVILLTAQNKNEDIVTGLEAGADDYVTKPFGQAELRARLKVGARTVALQRSLADRIGALQDALAQVKRLQGLLPMCAWCKKIRSDEHYWQSVDHYLAKHTEAQFSHGICPDCRETLVQPAMKRDHQAK